MNNKVNKLIEKLREYKDKEKHIAKGYWFIDIVDLDGFMKLRLFSIAKDRESAFLDLKDDLFDFCYSKKNIIMYREDNTGVTSKSIDDETLDKVLDMIYLLSFE